ncbi:MAG: DNA-formamidopyrimidine glycosylase [Candidatus Acidiferrales bacterium]
MPEGPEVEAVARTLSPLVTGHMIRRVLVRHAVAVRPQAPGTLRKAAGAQITAVERRGKHLLLALDRGLLRLHFKFDGKLLWFDGPGAAIPRGTHVDVALITDRGTLAFVDPRHLGHIHWIADPGDSASLRSLGVDCFSREFTADYLAECCRARPCPLKTLLVDQTRIAGIGNIYASESLWHAQLNPLRRSDALSAAEIRRLHKAVVSVLARALECVLDPPPDFRNPNWWFADLDPIVRVYGREGVPCPRCGKAIRRKKQAGRSTYFCFHCQGL